MNRLRASLTLAVGRDLLFAIAACAAAVLISLSVQLKISQRTLREHSLATAARYVHAHARIGDDGVMRLPVPPGSSWASFGYPTLIFDGAGQLLLKRPSGLGPAVVEAIYRQRPRDDEPQRPEALRFFRVLFGEQRIIGAALRVGSGNTAQLIEVFKDENAPDALVDEIVRQFPWRSIAVLGPVFVLLIVAGLAIVQRRVRPIAQVSAIAATIGPDTLNLRLPEENLPAEVLPIVRGVNGAFARLEAAAEAQREFLRRAAHHLRTPLTVLMARACSLGDSEAAAQLRRDVDEIARVITELLQLNELDALPDSAAAVADLGAVAEAVREELAARAGKRKQRIELAQPNRAVLVRGDPNVIEIAVRHLAENALQHSPAGATVTFDVRPDGELAVIDAGPGIAAPLREKIFEPFWSGDSQGRSAGLGLTLVRRVAERYGGTVRLAPAPGGGALFALRFALAAIAQDALDAAALRGSIPASLVQRRRRAALDPAAG